LAESVQALMTSNLNGYCAQVYLYANAIFDARSLSLTGTRTYTYVEHIQTFDSRTLLEHMYVCKDW
jgi:hypothetical protein